MRISDWSSDVCSSDLCLSDIRDNRGRLSSSTISTLSQLIYRLARTGLRHSDPHNQSFLPPLSKPVYIALQDQQRAEHLVRQLDFFSMSAQAFSNVAAFRTAMHRRHPAAIVMEEIGRASCRERVCRYGWISGGAGTYKKQKKSKKT